MIGSIDKKVLKQLGQFLIENGLNIIGDSRDGYDLLRRIHTGEPDLVILDFNMRGLNGYEISNVIISERICPVVALLNLSEVNYFVNLSIEPAFVPLVKPLHKQILLNTIELLVKTPHNKYSLENMVSTLKSSEGEDQMMERAKKLLMKNMHLTENDAHRRLQKESMNKGISKIKIAHSIIALYEEN